MPGYENILKTKTYVYKFVYENISNSKIYSVALRPYGLFRKNFSNYVFSDLGTGDMNWEYSQALKKIKQENFDYMFIGIKPNSKQFPKGIKKVINNNRLFKMIYQDSQVFGFKINKKY